MTTRIPKMTTTISMETIANPLSEALVYPATYLSRARIERGYVATINRARMRKGFDQRSTYRSPSLGTFDTTRNESELRVK
jgi:hypothetical protein